MNKRMQNIIIILGVIVVILMLNTAEACANKTALIAKVLTDADYAFTLEISDNDKFEELNPALGKNPSETEVHAFFLAQRGLLEWVNTSWTCNNRLLWNSVWLTGKGLLAIHNYNEGIRPSLSTPGIYLPIGLSVANVVLYDDATMIQISMEF